ncbi:MAG: HAMP domain-containing histidine kinase [Eubacterium sp.]|nr:HAMP domain-containing histidine kinase [Eubacterium sp.]
MKKFLLIWGVIFFTIIVFVVVVSIWILGRGATSGLVTQEVRNQTREIHYQLQYEDGSLTWDGSSKSLEGGFSFIVYSEDGDVVLSVLANELEDEDMVEVRDKVLQYNAGQPDSNKAYMTKIADVQYAVKIFQKRVTEGESTRVYYVVGLLRPDMIENVYRSVQWTLTTVVCVAGVVMLVILGIGINLFSRKIKEIKTNADNIGAQVDFSERIEQDRHFPELTALVDAHNRLLDQFEQILEGQKSFNRSVSHELRTPIAVIDGELQMLATKSELSGDVAERIERIKRQNQKMKDLIRELLILAQLDNASTGSADEDVQFDEVIEFICSDLEEITSRPDLITKELVPIKVHANMSYLVIVVENLLTNAVKYGLSDKPIEVRLWEEDDSCMLSVRDYGPGLSKELSEKMFDPFVRGDQSRSEKGYGLGLTLVKKIVSHYNGTVQVQSVEHQGSEFLVQLNLSLIKD